MEFLCNIIEVRSPRFLSAISCLTATRDAFANASVSTLANASLSADTAGITYTTLTGPALNERVFPGTLGPVRLS